jgi:toxin FitB
VSDELTDRFRNRILGIHLEVVNKWGQILAKAEIDGCPLLAIDSLIAATASVHDLAIVTANTKDFQRTGVELINPWE